MARKTLTDKSVAALKPRDKLYTFPDPGCVGHYVRVTPTGNKSFLAVARDPTGKQKWITIGNTTHFDIETARKKAREIIVSVKGGLDPEGPASFEKVAKDWLTRHCEAKGLLTTTDLRRYLEIHILPAWGGRTFTSIGRSDVTKLLDHIEDNSGPVAADKVLAIISSIFNFYASRNDNYNTPIVRGMRRSNSKERARERILSDDEIRLLWKAEGTMADIAKLLLLTAQRREKVTSMKWDDVSVVTGVWHVANGNKREKGTGGELVLPQIAVDIIRSRPRLASNPHVFPGMGDSFYKSYDRGKRALDKQMGELPHWQLHDLRRTARSLMSRAGVLPHISERVLGHVQSGVAGVYDRHQYRDEKAHALKALASLIQSIVNPTDKVIAHLESRPNLNRLIKSVELIDFLKLGKITCT
jgi:integrase